MLCLLLLLLVAREMDDLVLVAGGEFPRDRQLARRVAVIDPVARLAELPMRRLGPGRPVPASLVEHRAALPADRGFRQLEAGLVRIVDVLAKQPIAPGLPRNLALVLHFVLRAG
ncbi:MAG: hypothetical protein K0S96_1341 [Geminicoccaceae bacterium]|jgi:hypothetical protein|nr:hypothetical protein [Geminicoccaceae bacterium]